MQSSQIISCTCSGSVACMCVATGRYRVISTVSPHADGRMHSNL